MNVTRVLNIYIYILSPYKIQICIHRRAAWADMSQYRMKGKKRVNT